MIEISLWVGGASLFSAALVLLDMAIGRNLKISACGGWYLDWPRGELFQRFDVMREFHVECPLFRYHWFALDNQIAPSAKLRAVDRRFAISGDRNWRWP